ncbi:MAG: 16S rRNA (uracil(1498)-N(3))-methyltransferase [Clostridiales bacterium]|nr:16S rRNA (uracil(1498)-N(3))-methyltransferase [Clostridiales bacterium]
MPRFFVDEVLGKEVIMTGDDARHIGRSLRMKIGDEIIICARGMDYSCEIINISSDMVILKAGDPQICLAEPNISLTLYQAIPKNDKMESIIQKSVELGVSRIVPVLTNRCVSRPSEKDFAKKLVRYNKISLEASKQSGRGIIPEVTPFVKLEEALKEMAKVDCPLVLYEKGGIRFTETNVEKVESMAILVGSEGGFEESEITLAKSYGVQPLWLGHRILRCETAPLAAISIAMLLTKNL